MPQVEVVPSNMRENLSKSKREDRVPKKRRMEAELNDYLQPGMKELPARCSTSPRDSRDKALDAVASTAKQVEIRDSTRKSRRLRKEQEQEEAQMQECFEEERNKAEEVAALERLQKGPSEIECFKIRARKVMIERLHDEDLSKSWYPPKHGEFGEEVGYEGGNYTYNQNKRKHEAKVDVAKLEGPEPEYDDATDVDEELPSPKRLETERALSEEREPEGFALFAGNAAELSTEDFEASAGYQAYLNDARED